ncbi:bifunctional 3-demethylubiquinol 3-O-methyltransferase/2-polyprenyl-6-hydroxyphenol methylase [Legionella quinlivanii]|uniref:Ubiquinone biosynthesis O-methyltransferase n=1 Tax=Legionella quinlivanii TaxID=45073 RepID=A0A364LMH3_9GAMM|nr:bifunctional 2-polyprenyl-6-hydroxyphenol methylase/3-demethylubiquinol 3-O-methyltransferase UbiG [Legionella quinlivanii]RAP38078.1 bifunctional 3-demethylubiquinol 3-O-methyltransferase/2-polyprenyl-6-hydroxyphenol methylase [Legionella quinlivanii]
MTKSTIDVREVSKFNALSRHWWDKNGPLKTLHDINPARLQFIQKHALLSQARVLDVGCGGGILAEAIAGQGGVVTGIDADNDAIVTANTHALAQNLSINYHVTPIEDFEEPAFDVVTCMEMLEHVSNPELVIQHCFRLLKPGGKLFLSTINRTLKAYGAAIIAAEYILGLLPRQTHDYEKFIKPGELADILRSTGLQLIALEGINYNPFSRQAELAKSVDINYLMCAEKPG